MAACQSEHSEEQSYSLDNRISIEPNARISVGDKFSSYDDLKSRITAYEEEIFVQLMQRDSKTLAPATKRVPIKVQKANKSLKYYYIQFCCAFGGKDYKSRSSGKTIHQRYTNTHCCMFLVSLFLHLAH